MSNGTPSNLVKAQAKYLSRFTEAELRSKVSPSLSIGLKNKAALPEYEKLRTREDRTVSTYMKARNARATGTGRTYNHTGSRGDTYAVDLSWSTVSVPFSISLKQYDNNVYAWEEMYAHEIFTCSLDLHEKIETNTIDYLYAQRTQINAATARGTFNSTNYAFEIAESDKEQFYQIARAMMRANNYRGSFDVIANQLIYIDAEKYMNQGVGNSTNTSYQFQGLNIVESVELTDSNYAKGTSLIIPQGHFAILPWIPKQNVQGQGDYFSYVGGFGSIQDPTGSGLTLAMHAYASRADTSASNGDEQDVLLEGELSVDIAYALSPLSTATASVVFEAALKA